MGVDEAMDEYVLKRGSMRMEDVKEYIMTFMRSVGYFASFPTEAEVRF